MLNIVLYEPEIPANTGNIARTCAVTGSKLHLIKPLGFDTSEKQLRRSGLDYWDKLDVQYYENFHDFLEKNNNPKLYLFSTKAKIRYDKVNYSGDEYLVFGPESRGLPEYLIKKYYDNSLRIPMLPRLRSLNLSNSVAIACYEVLRQQDFKNMDSFGNLTDREEIIADWFYDL